MRTPFLLTMVSKTSKINGGAEHSKFSGTNVWRPYKSPAAYARTALRAYRDGMALTERDRNGEKVETSLRLDQELKEFWRTLPDQLRSRLLERAIRTYMRSRT
jgi:hypothetical protein